MQVKIALRGAGGEPVDWRRTVNAHGLPHLAPNRVYPGDEHEFALPTARGPVLARLRADPGGASVTATVRGRGDAALRRDVGARLRRMLCLDDDYAAFYARAAADPALAWVTAGAGRFVRSATAFEDVVKTMCTTNCAWSATIRMTDALVAGLGEAVPGAAGRNLFPTPAAMAAAPEAWYREVARAGYRGAYLRAVAAAVASGQLDLEELAAADATALPDDELERRLLALPGIGPYAAAHIMMLFGRFSRLVLDSSTRPAYARLAGRRPRSDETIRRRFAPYGRFAGLAFWCYVTSDWLDDASAAAAAAATAGSGSSSAT